MPIQLAASVTRSLNALPHHALVIDSEGIILSANLHWQAFNRFYRFSAAEPLSGVHYQELFVRCSKEPDTPGAWYAPLERLLRREVLVASAELTFPSEQLGVRRLRLEAFPLLPGPDTDMRYYVLTMQDAGAAASSGKRCAGTLFSSRLQRFRHPSPRSLIPICASCKSIRNTREEWVRIEQFLQQQWNMQFTHDICPDCICQLYPEYASPFKARREPVTHQAPKLSQVLCSDPDNP